MFFCLYVFSQPVSMSKKHISNEAEKKYSRVGYAL